MTPGRQGRIAHLLIVVQELEMANISGAPSSHVSAKDGVHAPSQSSGGNFFLHKRS